MSTAAAAARHIDGPCGTVRCRRAIATHAHTAVSSGAATAASAHTSKPNAPVSAADAHRELHVTGAHRRRRDQVHDEHRFAASAGRARQGRNSAASQRGRRENHHRARHRQPIRQPPLPDVDAG